MAIPLAAVVGVVVQLIRNTPFIAQLFFIVFGLPNLGVKQSPDVASIRAMVVNPGAYAAQIVRAGIEGTPRGQLDGARRLAMTEAHKFTRALLPPALGKVWPSLVNFTVWDIFRNLLLAARWTVARPLIAYIGGGLVGLGLLLARLAHWPGAQRFVAGYGQLLQRTPLLMQLLLACFGLRLVVLKGTALASVIGFIALTKAAP